MPGRAQVMLVSHSAAFVAALRAQAGRSGVDLAEVTLAKESGETVVEGLGRFEGASWKWPKR